MDVDQMITSHGLGSSFPLPHDQPFTAAHARAAGISKRTLSSLVEHGLVRRPVKSVYLATELGDSLRLRAECLRLVVPEDAVIVDRHAGWLHGASMVLRPNEHLELRPVSMFLPAGRGRLRNALADSGERHFRCGDVVEMAGLQVTSPLRTSWDLGRVRWADEAIAALDAMVGLGMFTLEELLDGVERFKGMRWVTTLRAIAPLADGRAKSPGESVLRLRCLEAGIRGMEPQVEVYRGEHLIARLDLADLHLLLAFEYDGIEWHSSPEQREHDRKRRTAVAEEGWLIKPFTKEDVFGRTRECDRIMNEAVREARARRGSRVVW